jgi:hypothetical protein
MHSVDLFCITALDPGMRLYARLFDVRRTSGSWDTPEARHQITATFVQESGLRSRRQRGGGPGRGLGQFENGEDSLIADVLKRGWGRTISFEIGLSSIASRDELWRACEYHDVLSVMFARDRLRLDPHPLPAIGERAQKWALYLRTWAPGKPRPDDWDHSCNTADVAMAWVP